MFLFVYIVRLCSFFGSLERGGSAGSMCADTRLLASVFASGVIRGPGGRSASYGSEFLVTHVAASFRAAAEEMYAEKG